MSTVAEILASQLEVPDLLTGVEVALAHFASDARRSAVAGKETLSLVVRSLTGMRKHKYGLFVETNGVAYDERVEDGNVSSPSSDGLMPSLNFIFFDAACRDAIFEAGGALCFSQVADKMNASTLGRGLRWEAASESASQFHERRTHAAQQALKKPEDGAGHRLSLLRLCRSLGHKCYFMLPLPIIQRDGETCCARTRVALALLELRRRMHDRASDTSLLDLSHQELDHQANTKALPTSVSCSSLSTQPGTDSEDSDGDDTSSSDEEPPCVGSLRQRCLRILLPRYDLSGSEMDHTGHKFGRARYNALPYAACLHVAEVSDLQSLPARVNSVIDENGVRCSWRHRAFYRTSSTVVSVCSQTGQNGEDAFGVDYIGALTAEPPSAYYGDQGIDASLSKLPVKRYYPSEYMTRFDCFREHQNLA